MDSPERWDGTSCGGWVRAQPTGTPPAARCSHTATLVGGHLYVIGGGHATATAGFVHYGDVHALDVTSLRWTLALGEGDFPGRRGHTACLHEQSGRVVVFGGTRGNLDGPGCRNDTW